MRIEQFAQSKRQPKLRHQPKPKPVVQGREYGLRDQATFH
jgi:hypothetical protein